MIINQENKSKQSKKELNNFYFTLFKNYNKLKFYYGTKFYYMVLIKHFMVLRFIIWY